MTTITGRRAAVVASAAEAAGAAVVSADLAAEDAVAASAVDSVEAAVAAEEDSPAVAAVAVEAVAGKPSAGYLKNHPMVAARKDYSCFMT